jgi:type VI secretion system secreted protein Hcp
MAFPAYLSVKGNRQGQFKGESTEQNRKDKWMVVLSFAMDLEAPRDPTTGQPAGKREWKPVKIVKEWGAASPQALTACATNEVLSEVVIEFTKTNPNGNEYVYQRVSLADATISAIYRFTGQPDAPDGGTTPKHVSWANTYELERWSFTFEKIEVVDIDANTAFSDDWLATP